MNSGLKSRLRGCVRFLAVAAVVCGAPAGAAAGFLSVGSGPLTVEADEYGTIGVYYQQETSAVPQYYAARSKGSVLHTGDREGASRWGSGAGTFALWDNDPTDRFASVSHQVTGPGVLETRFTARGGTLDILQVVTYTEGNPHYDIAWEVRAPQGAVSGLRWLHGGDVAPHGADSARGLWSAASNTVYVVTSNGVQGAMGLTGITPPAPGGYMENHFQLVRDACKTGTLSGAVAPGEHDAAYALEWDRAELGAGEVWRIEAREWWSPAAASGGLLICIVEPGEAATAAQWRVTSGADTGWHDGGETIGPLTAAVYMVTFSPLAGWITPAGRTVAMGDGVRVSVTGRYARAETLLSADPSLERPLTAWTLNRQTGTYFGEVTLHNAPAAGGAAFGPPFLLVLEPTAERRFMAPDGALPDGRSYIDLTASVLAAEPDGLLDPGDRVVAPDVEVYMMFRYPPPDAWFSVLAAPVP